MKGKISKIKNTKGELALPVTTVEAIYMEDGITKLSDEMKDVLKYEEFDNEDITAEIPSVKEEINGIKKNISEINSSLDKKASLQECKEEIAKAQLEGAGVDTSNFVFKSEINKIIDISDVNEYQYDIIDGLCCWKSGLVQSGIGGAYGVKLNVKAGQKYLLSGISSIDLYDEQIN